MTRLRDFPTAPATNLHPNHALARAMAKLLESELLEPIEVEELHDFPSLVRRIERVREEERGPWA